MADKEVDYSTIRIKNTIRKELDSFKTENETYTVVIANLIEENKTLKEDVEYLKEEKQKILKLALKTSDSEALVNNVHIATYFITKIISDRTLDKAEQLNLLETYLSEMLTEDKDSVVIAIDNLKVLLGAEEESVPDVLFNFEDYVLKFEK